MKHTNLIVGLAVAAGLGGACSDDPETSAPTTEAYCEVLAAMPEDDAGGPIDEIFEIYGDDPTLENWAEFLPSAIESIREDRETFDAIEPSAELSDQKADLIASLDEVIGNFEASRSAAAAGDQAEFDAVEEENQGEDVPVMVAAFEAIGTACGLGSE
jgi:hypothetical protein